jgi:hypothetical protein
MPNESFLRRCYPNLSTSQWRKTSDETPDYNCIAWVMNDTENWWDPDYFWPTNISKELPVRTETVIELCKLYNYELCENGDLEVESIKIAIYADQENYFQHIARQNPNGKWTSKLGDWEDIEHQLVGLSGRRGSGMSPVLPYGTVVRFLKKPH